MTLQTEQEIDYEELLTKEIFSFSHDPEGFVNYVFPWGEKGTPLADKTGPRTWQSEALNHIKERLEAGHDAGVVVSEAIQMAYASGHGIGKSALVSWIVLWAVSTYIDTRGVVTANTESQLRTKTWPEVAKWYQMMIHKDWFKYTATAIFSSNPKHEKNWRIDAVPWSEHNMEAFAGLHNEGNRILVIFDEASAIHDAIWETTEGALTDANTEIIWCVFGNPTRNTGRFRQCFGSLSIRWHHKQIDSRDVEGTNKKQFEIWIEDYGEDSDFVRIRIKGQFPRAGTKQFIPGNLVDEAFGKHIHHGSYNFAPVVIGVDPAWEGDDEFVIVLRQGLMSKILGRYPKNDNDVQMANIVARFEDEHKADAVFVDMGYGTGVVSAARTMNREWTLVSFSETSADKGCKNKRAEMWNNIKSWLQEGGCIPAEEDLRQDLIGPETVGRLDGLIQLEPKAAMKKRGLKSPNIADALGLTFAHPVATRQVSNTVEVLTHDDYHNPEIL